MDKTGNFKDVNPLVKEYATNIFVSFYIVAQLVFRVILSVWAIYAGHITGSAMPGILLAGFASDIISTSFALPIIGLLQRIPFLRVAGHFIFSLAIVFIGIAQLIFWDEFNTNFNFIAVDYLIYTSEIFGTLTESLPLNYIIIGGIVFALILTRYTYKLPSPKPSYKLLLISFLCAITIGKLYSSDKFGPTSNSFAHEISKNGPYEFIYAYFNNSLDYTKFYPLIGSYEAQTAVRTILDVRGGEGIGRNIRGDTSLPRRNVVLITVESLSAEYMAHFGNIGNVTPHLDKLADEGLLFTKIYATGTRTVRGLEAVTVGLPPIPGTSIIRRPNNNNLFTIGSPLREHGYETDFVYGGYSYFDNLENYFKGNGFAILDRSDLSNDEITMANIWGVADEDIFNKTLSRLDSHYKNGKNFLSIIMTTSNHRPYTFPEGKIDEPSGSRGAAVKYTDYAIWKFIEDAKLKPWFKDTIFVITADHCASSAGKAQLPVEKYHIPLIIYAPDIIKPAVNNNLASQIDIPTTIMGMMNFSYYSKFLGQDLMKSNPNRAFISTYQLMGYLKDDILVILSPMGGSMGYRVEGDKQSLIEAPEILRNEAIAYYQAAYELFTKGKMKDGL